MSQQDFEIRFNQARLRLNSSLKDLEKAIDQKLLNAAEARGLGLEDEKSEQIILIQNLKKEVNDLHKSLARLHLEKDSLLKKNVALSSNFNKFRSDGLSLIDAIESDLVKIENIVEGEKND